MFQKDMRLSALIDIYGSLLTERKKDIMELYYNDDLSLAEIAEDTGISRQGVRDAIKKSEAELASLEDKLHLLEIYSSFDAFKCDFADRLETICSSLPSDLSDQLSEMIVELRNRNL